MNWRSITLRAFRKVICFSICAPELLRPLNKFWIKLYCNNIRNNLFDDFVRIVNYDFNWFHINFGKRILLRIYICKYLFKIQTYICKIKFRKVEFGLSTCNARSYNENWMCYTRFLSSLCKHWYMRDTAWSQKHIK